MANFYGTARTNYFKVKDAEAFKSWVNSLPNLVLIQEDGLFGFYSDCPNSGCFPSSWWDDEKKDFVEIDLIPELADHLTEDTIAVLMEACAEKLQYISAWAQAVNHKGEVETISLFDIYGMAEKRFGIKPTPAEC